MHLKLAEASDTYDILDLVEELFYSSVYSTQTKMNKQDVLTVIKQIITGSQNNGVIILLRNDSDKTVGLLAASVVEQLFNRKERTGAELAFWIKPEHRTGEGLRLLIRAFRFWSKKVGCTSIMLGKMKSDSEIETYSLRKLKK